MGPASRARPGAMQGASMTVKQHIVDRQCLKCISSVCLKIEQRFSAGGSQTKNGSQVYSDRVKDSRAKKQQTNKKTLNKKISKCKYCIVRIEK